MSFDILTVNNFNLDNLVFSRMNEINDYKKINVQYNYESGNTSNMRIATTSWIDFLNVKNGTCMLSFKRMSTDLKLKSVFDLFKAFDTSIINKAKTEWFRGTSTSKIKFKKSVMRSTLVSDVEEDNKTGWVYPILRCSISDAEIYNRNGEQIELRDVTPNMKVKVVLECCGVWIHDHRIGSGWKVVQLLTGPEDVKEMEYSFAESDDELDVDFDYVTDIDI